MMSRVWWVSDEDKLGEISINLNNVEYAHREGDRIVLHMVSTGVIYVKARGQLLDELGLPRHSLEAAKNE